MILVATNLRVKSNPWIIFQGLYHEVKTWFLDQFPEIKAFHEKREKLLEKIAAKAEAEAQAKALAKASA